MKTLEEKNIIKEIVFKCLGTTINVRIVVNQQQSIANAKNDLFEIQEIYFKTEKTFSRFDPESELSWFNSNLNQYKKTSSEMLSVSKKVLKCYKETGGFFDPRIIEALEKTGYDKNFDDISNYDLSIENEIVEIKRDLVEDILIDDEKLYFAARMDFSGIVKGYITDRVSDFLSQKGWRNFLVDSGGDIFFAGKDEENNPWYVDLEGFSHEKMMFALSDMAIATSGIGKRKWEKNGKRFHHLVNPKNPNDFSFDLKSVTVIAKTTEQADVWAKTLFLMGKDDAIKYAKEKEIACVILDYKGSVWISSIIKKYLYEKKL